MMYIIILCFVVNLRIIAFFLPQRSEAISCTTGNMGEKNGRLIYSKASSIIIVV